MARTDDSDDSIDFEKERAAFEQKKKSRKSDGGKDRPKTESKRAPRDEKADDKKSKPKKSKKDAKPPKEASARSKGKDIPNDDVKSRDKHREHVMKADQGAGVGVSGAHQQQTYEGRQQRLSESSDEEREGGVQKKQVKKKKRTKKETKMPDWLGNGENSV